MRDSKSSFFEEALVAPSIPDYQMIRRIGGGAYGQVWMARSVTGAYRAVKLVSREDFRLEKTFEREFEGIKYFESVSRVHPGLVDILHVGRSDENFYFYVMELADDQRTGDPAAGDPLDYRPRTLRSDINSGRNLSVRDCARVGAVLGEALHYLHERGLTHRDVKPSNVIFVDGKAKLADIGLVAETGQQTFVGTEGFVPPEGPGSVQADIFSLGMVLYEMSTGKDRLDFPELPDHLQHRGDDRELWTKLNEIVCRCGRAEPRKRYKTAMHMAVELQRLAGDAEPAPFPWARALALSAASAFVLWGLAAWQRGPSHEGRVSPGKPKTGDIGLLGESQSLVGVKDESPRISSPSDLPLPNRPREVDPRKREEEMLVLTSQVKDAWVYTRGGRELGRLPLSLGFLRSLRTEEIDEIVIESSGYKPLHFDLNADYQDGDGDNEIELVPARKPTPLRAWTNSLGMVFHFDAENGRHVSRWPVTSDHFDRFLEGAWPRNEIAFETVPAETLYPGFDGSESQLVLTDLETAEAFCRWLTEHEGKQRTVFLHIGQVYEAEAVEVFAGPHVTGDKILFRCQLEVVQGTTTDAAVVP